jgi:aminoglycoside 6'-N-acetyltransferase
VEHEKIRLRAAQVDDIPLLTHWDEQPHVIESDPNDDWNWEFELARDPEWREQLVAEADGVPIGFVQIIDPAREDTHYWGECPPNLRAIDIWIGEASYIGRGVGTRIMQLAIERCFSDPSVGAIVIDPLESNTRARRFYEKIGFTFVDIRRFGEDVCAVYCLDREEWQTMAGRENAY